MRRWRSILRTVLVYALLGLGTSGAVVVIGTGARGVMRIRGESTIGDGYLDRASTAIWSGVYLPASESVDSLESCFQEVRRLTPSLKDGIVMVSYAPHLEPRRWWSIVHAGWPMKAFWGWSLDDRFNVAASRSGGLVRVPRSNGTMLDLPFWPIWGGLAVNTALYGLAWWGAVVSLRAVRRWWRKSRGNCGGCGYPLVGLGGGQSVVCPECGQAGTRKRSTPTA